jgi:hypothetical protein
LSVGKSGGLLYKPEKLLDTLHASNRDFYPLIYSIISILLAMLVSSATSERSISAIRCVKSYLRSTLAMNDCPTNHLCIYTGHVQVDLDMNIDDN